MFDSLLFSYINNNLFNNHSSLSCASKETKVISDVAVKCIQRQEVDSDDSMCCDDPGISQTKPQISGEKSKKKPKG